MPDAPERARHALSPAQLILAATVFSGAGGYLIAWIVPTRLSVAEYTGFAVLWSTLFLLVGALSGVQQELARASSIAPGVDTAGGTDAAAAARTPRPRLAIFAVLVGATVLVTVSLVAVIARPSGDDLALVAIVALGSAAYGVVATFVGGLYGAAAWPVVAAMIAADGVLRLGGVALALALSSGLVGIAVAVAAPFPLALLVLAPWLRRALRPVRQDVGVRRLGFNSARALVATGATAVIVSGFPALLTATSPGAEAARLAPLLLALTLTRAPIVTPVLAMQSYLVVRFRGDRAVRPVITLTLLVLGVSATLAVLAGLIGPPVLTALFGPEYAVDPIVTGLLVLSSGAVAALAVTGSAMLARSGHWAFAGGWLVAAAVTLGALLLPLPVEGRTVVALIAGPFLGLAVHLLVLWRRP